ncbi:hypothetical protein THAOC_33290 [Thalassiosira oceanica]|uniref:Rieske domain-containing protein n=1 Tax=Thalassiosira oceanica TaxID=159749 RepID=K0R5E1_THAOC|nr:hypothetical protein THAOC_33290 [Thalassiosira oceanica]|eukprot:EJK47955.1 hypothetical protein THAOC_33290 [Thalassiosira oceanica]
MPLGSASSLTGLSPVQVRVCGLDIAVWHAPLLDKRQRVAANFSAFVDACPHRLAPLSQGRVDDVTGCIECPYHGWQFDSSGNLTALPQLDPGKRLESVTAGREATALPVHKAGDLLFVFLPTELTGESWPISRLPEHHYPYLQDNIDEKANWYVRELPYSFDFLLENFLDPVPFAHHSLQGTRDDGSNIQMEVVAQNFTHFETTFVDICRGKERDGVLSFQRPAFYHFRVRENETAAYDPKLHIFCTPVEAGRCRVMLKEFEKVPSWLGHLGSNRFLNTDLWLHETERAVRLNDDMNKLNGPVSVGLARRGKTATVEGLNYVIGTKSDLGPTQFRKWLNEKFAVTSPFGPSDPASLPRHSMTRAEQIDPWVMHARTCSKCQRALRFMRRMQGMCVAMSAAGAIALRNRPPIAISLVLAGVYLHDFLRRFRTAIEGNPKRSDVAARSVAVLK